MKGVKSYQVASILADGYLEEHNKDDELKSASNDLQEELKHGTSYCEVENEVKKLSFVFAECGRYEHLNKTDKNDSSLTHDLFVGGKVGICADPRIPTYLIVFELK